MVTKLTYKNHQFESTEYEHVPTHRGMVDAHRTFVDYSAVWCFDLPIEQRSSAVVIRELAGGYWAVDVSNLTDEADVSLGSALEIFKRHHDRPFHPDTGPFATLEEALDNAIVMHVIGRLEQ